MIEHKAEPKLISHEIDSRLLCDQTVMGPDRIWQADDLLVVSMQVEVDGVEYDVEATVQGGRAHYSTTLSLTPERLEWLGQRVDEIWDEATEDDDEDDDE